MVESNNERGITYYTRYDREGGSGVVYTSPPIPKSEVTIFTGRTKTDLELEIEKHSRIVRENFTELARLRSRFSTITDLANKKLLSGVLEEPGLIPLGDDYFTGWFYISDGDNVFTNKAVTQAGEMPVFNVDWRGAMPKIFKLDKEIAEDLDSKVKTRPLNIEEAEDIRNRYSLREHPLFQRLIAYDLSVLVQAARMLDENFWDEVERLQQDETSEKLYEFFKKNLLELVIVERTLSYVYRNTMSSIRETMKSNGITVYPLSEEGSVVGLDRGGPELKYRVLPLTSEHRRLFQKSKRHREKPMTEVEFLKRYRAIINPDFSFQRKAKV